MDRFKNIAWGMGGALIAIVLWLLVSTVYRDHVLLQEVVRALNQAAAQQQAAPRAPVAAPAEAPKK